ncbi:MAG: FtsX-like permease family protein [Lachnospiraceae bacterium]|nr:FtsX-like permease family protein [Lachnospiraceae bacterium]
MKDNIYIRMTKKSLQRDRFATISFSALVMISITMIALTVMLFTNLTGAIDNLMKMAKTPDYLQMHTGETDTEEIERFVRENSEVTDYQILSFLNLDNTILSLGGESLIDSTQDNGVCVQGSRFDYMLGMDNKLPKVFPGQVYVPVCYESVYNVKTGDIMKIGKEELEVAGFIRDSQMNSMMASSKRFLVCEEDYIKLKPLGREEYLIEFLFDENTDNNAFKTAYENAKLPMNGPTITSPLIKMMNTLSDGIMILIILIISLLVLTITLVCIRFMLLTRVVSEAGEVGLLKAIGISKKNIRAMFLRRYCLLTLTGGILGVIVSLLVFEPLSVQMQKLYGVSENNAVKIFFALLSAVLVGVGIILFVLVILRKLNEMTALKALTGNIGERKKSNKFCVGIVTAIAVFLMMIPSNLYTTLSAPEFVTYMGIGNAQIRMDMREGETGREDFNRIKELLSEDSSVEEYALYQTCSTHVKLNDGTSMNMLMEQGNHKSFPVTYSKGCEPDSENEVALSYLLSEELGLYPGDTFQVEKAGRYEECKVSGIYSDITNGGKTAKIFTDDLDDTENVMWRIGYVMLKENANQQAFVDKYTSEGAEVVDILSRIKGTYGPTLMQVQKASIMVKVISVLIILLVITLFVRMIIANQRNQMSVKKAIGFKTSDIRKAFCKSCVPYIVTGIILGTLCGCTLGENICGVALQSLGATDFKFVLNIWPVTANIIFGSVAAMLAVYLGSTGIKNIKAVECCSGRE